MKTGIKISILTSLFIFLAGCGASAPNCSNSKTKDLATKIIKNEYVKFIKDRLSERQLKEFDADTIKIGLNNIRAKNYDSEIDRYKCEGSATMKSTKDDNDASAEFSVEYSSQINNEGKHIVDLDFQSSWREILQQMS